MCFIFFYNFPFKKKYQNSDSMDSHFFTHSILFSGSLKLMNTCWLFLNFSFFVWTYFCEKTPFYNKPQVIYTKQCLDFFKSQMYWCDSLNHAVHGVPFFIPTTVSLIMKITFSLEEHLIFFHVPRCSHYNCGSTWLSGIFGQVETWFK